MGADPVLGSAIVLLMAAIVFLVVWVKSLISENSDAKEKHLEDVKKYAADNEATRSIVAANTEQIKTNTETMKSMIDVFRERVR